MRSFVCSFLAIVAGSLLTLTPAACAVGAGALFREWNTGAPQRVGLPEIGERIRLHQELWVED